MNRSSVTSNRITDSSAITSREPEGDQINALLAGCGFNLRKLLRAFFLFLFKERLFILSSSFIDSVRTFFDQYDPENRVFQG